MEHPTRLRLRSHHPPADGERIRATQPRPAQRWLAQQSGEDWSEAEQSEAEQSEAEQSEAEQSTVGWSEAGQSTVGWSETGQSTVGWSEAGQSTARSAPLSHRGCCFHS